MYRDRLRDHKAKKMALGEFVLDFFFGPCLDPSSSVDPRQNQPQHHEQHHVQQQQQHPPAMMREPPPGGGHQQQLIYPPTIPENAVQQQQYAITNGNGGTGSKHDRRNGQRNGSATNGRHHHHHRGGRSGSGGPKRYSHRGKSEKSFAENSGISSLSDSFGGGTTKNRYRRDDASVISASLNETYKGYMADQDGEEDLDLDEQTAIRRSLKDRQRSNKNNKNRAKKGSRRSPGRGRRLSDAGSQDSDLNSWLERKKTRASKRSIKSARSLDTDDLDNVTTISKASKNPYGVLGISQSASPRELYGSYKRRMREAERSGGSDRAFEDVGNAYRRIRADMKRQEKRRERRRADSQRRREENGADGVQPTRRRSSSGGEKKKGGNDGGDKRQRRGGTSLSDEEESEAKSRRETVDARLKDHRELVQDLFAKDNSNKNNKRKNGSSGGSVSSRGKVATLQNSVMSQSQALSELNIVPIDAGANNVNEQNRTICNSCFYLSLAASYLSGVGAFANDPTKCYYLNTLNAPSGGSVATVELEIASLPPEEKRLTMNLALQLKRAIEAAVLLVHPDWAESGVVGESVQAFSDFLVYALDSDSVLGHWAIAVFDEASGFVDVYRGRHYGKAYPPTKVKRRRSRSRGGGRRASPARVKYRACDEETRRANTLTLRYVPGHYQPLLPELTKMKRLERSRREGGHANPRPTLEHVLATLEKWNVLHVVTDGRA